MGKILIFSMKFFFFFLEKTLGLERPKPQASTALRKRETYEHDPPGRAMGHHDQVVVHFLIFLFKSKRHYFFTHMMPEYNLKVLHNFGGPLF